MTTFVFDNCSLPSPKNTAIFHGHRQSASLRTSSVAGALVDNGRSLEEMDKREKVVKHMWDTYTNSHQIRIAWFRQEMFEAVYEDLTSDVPSVREAAISEIAKMPVRFIDLNPPLVQSTY